MRQAIRDQVKAQIATRYSGSINASRVRDRNAGNLDSFVEVVLIEGDTQEDNLQSVTIGRLSVGVYLRAPKTDAELDALGDLCNQAILTDRSLGDRVYGVTPAGFRYEDVGESNYSTLYLFYNVIYQEAYT